MSKRNSTTGPLPIVFLLGGAVLLASMLVLMNGRTALAHAKVIDATPKMGSTIAQAPTTLTVTTAEDMHPDPNKSYLQVYGPAGELVSQSDSKVPLSNPKELSVTLKPMGIGVYVVRWFTTSSADNDPDEGAFIFTVNPNATSSATAPTSRPTTASMGVSGVPLWVPVVSAIVALLVGLGGGIGIGRRRGVPSSLGALRRSVQERREAEEPTSERS